jgi:hypothetical protein
VCSGSGNEEIKEENEETQKRGEKMKKMKKKMKKRGKKKEKQEKGIGEGKRKASCKRFGYLVLLSRA